MAEHTAGGDPVRRSWPCIFPCRSPFPQLCKEACLAGAAASLEEDGEEPHSGSDVRA
jgi:hypothetical protein